MYFGVNNDHEVIGLENVDRLMEDIPNKIVTTMGIVVDVNLYEMKGMEYIEVVVEPSNIPINFKGKYYYRSGSTMQELRGPALQQFVLKKMGRSWDDITNDFATIDDLDRSAIEYFLRKGIKAGRISEDEANASTHSVLENLHLLSEDGKLKNAALLLFAKNPQRYFTCVEFIRPLLDVSTSAFTAPCSVICLLSVPLTPYLFGFARACMISTASAISIVPSQLASP